MQPNLTAKGIVTQPYVVLLYMLALWFVLPQYGGAAVMLGSAGGFSALVAANPEPFRGRDGSLTTASWLVIAMWIAAAVVATLALLGEIQN